MRFKLHERQLGQGPFSNSAVVMRENVCRAQRSFCWGLKESNCGNGELGHNRSRRVRVSPNADSVIIGEQKAKCQAFKNVDKFKTAAWSI
ncbi:MAG: hypothetical protein ACRD41_16905, partial [Candidatus Acidiferrales bacterium]